MSTRITRRLLVGFGAAVAGLALIPPTAVSAAPAAAFELYFPDLTVAADTAGVVELPLLVLDPASSWNSSTPVRKPEVSVDFGDAAALFTVAHHTTADYDDDFTCHTAGTVLTCRLDQDQYLDEDLDFQDRAIRLATLVVKPTLRAKLGDQAKLKFTAKATGLSPLHHEAVLTVGEGVDLSAGPVVTAGAAPGGRAEVTPQVRNNGKKATEGAVLTLRVEGAPPAQQYRNCKYGASAIACTFEQRLEPGRTYQPTEPLSLPIPADMAAPIKLTGTGEWLTPDDYASNLGRLGRRAPSTAGAGGELRLVEKPAAARVAQTDVDPTNGRFYFNVAVTGSNPLDVAAIGSTVSGTIGQQVSTKVGLKNLGPATLYPTTYEAYTLVHVVFPEGTKVNKAGQSCVPQGSGGDDVIYACRPGVLRAGETQLFDFTFTLNKTVAKQGGKVRVNGFEDTGPEVLVDKFAANDPAAIRVQLSANGNGGGNANGGGNGGGGLPVTGPATSAMAGAGVLLVILGGLAVLATRRRVRHSA